MRIANIINDSIVDGPGLRWTVFTQGCFRSCPGCHNPQTWDIHQGTEISADGLIQRFSQDVSPMTQGVTISGGEPFLWADELVPFAEYVTANNYDLWVFTGHTLDEVRDTRLARLADALVTEPFILSERSLNIRFVGSRNQRVIYNDKTESGNIYREFIERP